MLEMIQRKCEQLLSILSINLKNNLKLDLHKDKNINIKQVQPIN